MITHIGERWGNYQLVQLLGQGGFAEVYLGEHMRLGMHAAIKILHSRLAGNDIADFQREARTIAELAHPHIIRVLDFDVQQGVPFLVLEYAPNGSLRQKHPYHECVPLAQVGDYTQQIASALQYAHDRKLIHRDVKPENMLLNVQGQVVLTDFGIATLAHSTSSMRTQETTGTLAYMAPEQIQGKPRPASDQYALAVIVYQWLTGSLPFQGSSTELIAQHLAVPPLSLREKAPDIPLEVDQVILTALAKDPGARFGSVQSFANALAQASGMASPPVQPAPTPTAFAAPQVHTALADTPPVASAHTMPATPATPLVAQFTTPRNRATTSEGARGETIPAGPGQFPLKKRSIFSTTTGKIIVSLLVVLIISGSVLGYFIFRSNINHGLPDDVPLPNNATFVKTVQTQGAIYEQWFYTIGNTTPNQVSNFYQTQLPIKGWSPVVTDNGVSETLITCKGNTALIVGADTQENAAGVTPPQGGVVLVIMLRPSSEVSTCAS